jgi:hypothetical protein
LNSGVFKVLLRDTVIRKVQVLNESQILFNKDQKLFRYDLESGESSQLLPGVEIRTFAVGPEQTAYLFTSDSEPVILKLDFLTANSVDVIAGPFTSSPLLAQVRDDVDLLVNPRFVTSDIAVSTNGDVAVVDSSRYGSSIGVLVAGDDEFTVVAGKGPIDDTGDGRLATDATVRPGAIAFDEAGNLYLDSYTRIRRINRPEALN